MISRSLLIARQCSRVANTSQFVRSSAPLIQSRSFGSSVEQVITATDAFQRSCYLEINFSIDEDSSVYEAVQQFSAYDIGALVTTDKSGMIDSTD